MNAVTVRRIVLMFVGLVMASTGLTMVFLGMRTVMDIGGTCASGGPYVVAQPCPEGAVALIPGGIIGGLIGVFIYAAASSKLPGPRLALLAWSALFLSLGWNFWEYGLNPPDGSDGVVWGWIICGVVFVIMGGLPLFALFNRDMAKQILWADAPSPSAPAPMLIPRPVSRPTTRVQPPPAETDDSVAGALERLAQLHRSGALTDEEFHLAKQQILGGQ